MSRTVNMFWCTVIILSDTRTCQGAVCDQVLQSGDSILTYTNTFQQSSTSSSACSEVKGQLWTLTCVRMLKWDAKSSSKTTLESWTDRETVKSTRSSLRDVRLKQVLIINKPSNTYINTFKAQINPFQAMHALFLNKSIYFETYLNAT